MRVLSHNNNIYTHCLFYGRRFRFGYRRHWPAVADPPSMAPFATRCSRRRHDAAIGVAAAHRFHARFDMPYAKEILLYKHTCSRFTYGLGIAFCRALLDMPALRSWLYLRMAVSFSA